MSIFVKPKLKALKECLAAKDWPGVEKNANAVLDFESANYNARVFLALALFHQGKFDESEEGYKKAIELAPSQALARQGLTTFYEKRQRWADYARGLQELMQLFAESQDAPKYAESLEKLLDVRRKHGTKEELIESLSHLLPSSPSYPLLRSLPPYNATAPTSTTYPIVQRSITSPLPVFLELISLTHDLETSALEAEIKKRRQRLGGPALTAEETRRQVQAEQLPSSRLPGLWRAVLDDPDAANDEALRREIERKLLDQLRTTLQALPSAFDPPKVDLTAKAKQKTTKELEAEAQAKGYYRQQVEELAKGVVVIGVPEPAAWEVAIEWSDCFAEPLGRWSKGSWDQLRRFGDLFSESGLALIAGSLHQRLLASQVTPPAEGEEPSEEVPAPSDDEIAETIEDGLAKSPSSLVAHLLAASFFREQKEWEALFQVSEAALSVLSKLETEIGRGLPRSKRTLESHLAIALVHHEPPTHHLRALRLLDSLLSTPPSPPISPSAAPSSHPDPELLIAKARVLQSSEKYPAALKVWDEVLALPASTLSPDALTDAKGERAWALHLAGSSEDARPQLEEVVKALEERKVVRDKEAEEKERYRSKRGLERPEGVEEGEQERERDERAQAWWRLGECVWTLSRSTPDLADDAYTAFIAALRASPAYAPAFTSLGLYYRSLSEPDWERSSKCFQKAFELDPSEEVAARYLAEEFAELGEWGLVEVIARRVVEGNKGKAGMGGKAAARLAWAWKAIGGAELASKKYPQAITAFQTALRGAAEDVSTWIKLGVAYRSCGKHIAALKTFVKALGLDPSSWYARYSIADVQREIGLLEPAIATFKEILADRPDELGVRVVLAETALSKGLDEQKRGFTVRAEESLVEALKEGAAIIEGGTATRVAWKVVGDALAALGKLPEPELAEQSKLLALKVLDFIAQQGVDDKIDGMNAVTVAALEPLIDDAVPLPHFVVALSVLACKMRVLLETQNEMAIGSAWFDLGIAISNLRPRLSSFPSFPVSADQALQQSIRCLKFALHKEPLNSTFWNALGVVSFDLSPRLAQHCFIRSIEHNSRTAVPWTNLGLFYLVHADEDLANQAFLKAQVLDPDWTAAWVGQATLADMAGHAVEASVLLEHAFSLGGDTPEADIAFASRAFAKYRASVPSSSISTALSSPVATPSAVESLSAPLFAVTRYLAQRPTDHHALHLNALILEQVGDLASASASFEKAAALLEELYEVDESPAVEGQYVIAQTNLGRVRLASENYEGALEAFDAALSLLNLEAFEAEGGLTKEQSVLLLTECKLGSSLAHFRLDDPHQAKEVLESGLDDLEGLDQNGYGNHLAVALGKVHWAEDNEDRALAAFMDAPDMPNSRTSPLFLKRAVQAYAIAANDTALLQTVKRSNSESAVKYDPGIARITTLGYLAKGDSEGALATTSRSLHAFPWAPVVRISVAHLLFTLPPLPLSPGDSPPSSSSLSALTPNVDINARLVRSRVRAGQDASLRAQRARMLGTIKLVEAAEKDDEAADETALRYFETSVFVAPWDQTARDQLELVVTALQEEQD
ncbi:hypothetical protein JCM5296_001762 [Sporobolomyces johnsonii]